MRKRSCWLMATAAMLLVLSGCQSKKDAVQLACDAPNHVDNALPPDARGQALANYVEKNVKNAEVLELLGSAKPRMIKGEELDAMAKAEGVEPCALSKLWSVPPLPPMPPMSAMPPMPPMSAMPPMPPMSAMPMPPGSGRAVRTGVQVEGELEVGEIRSVVEKHTEAVSACYKAGLKRDKKLEGRVLVRFVIDATGKVKRAEDADSTLPDAEVVKCVVGAIEKLEFPKPAKGEVVVTYPFLLKLGT